MALKRIRVSVAALAVAVMLLYGLAGHGVHDLSLDDGMAGAVAALCLLLVTVVGHAAAPKPDTRARALVIDSLWVSARPQPYLSSDGRTRASPSSLQRFRN